MTLGVSGFKDSAEQQDSAIPKASAQAITFSFKPKLDFDTIFHRPMFFNNVTPDSLILLL